MHIHTHGSLTHTYTHTHTLPTHQVANEASACYRELYPLWSALAAEPHGCSLEVVQTRQSFVRAFDDDDTLAYSPEYTAAIILSERCFCWLNMTCD
jgi:hypothetical protein